MSLKLTYFNVKGAGELPRYILAFAGAEYEDNRIERENWPAMKPTTPLGQLPVFEVDGKMYAQSVTIARYLANKYDLAGKTPEEKMYADMIVDTFRMDMSQAIMKWMFEQDEEKKKGLHIEAVTKVTGLLKCLEGLVQGDGTFLASGISWADLCFFNAAHEFFPMAKLEVPAELTKLHKIFDNIKTQPAIKDWIEKRPVTER